MQSSFGVVAVPAIPAAGLGPFYVSPDATVVRLLVRNLSGTAIFFAFASSAVNDTNVTSQRFELPAGTSEVFVLQPRQSVYAIAPGSARLCYAASEALPIAAGGH